MKFKFILRLLGAACAAGAAELESGPKVGVKVPALEIQDITGSHAGKKVDYPALRKAETTVYVLMREEGWGRPAARYLRALDDALTSQNKGGYLVAVWLAADKEKTKAQLPRVHEALKFKSCALALFPGDAAGPPAWQLNDRALVTTLVVVQGKIHARFAYASLNETDAPPVVKAVEAAGK